jgi:2-haloacid dehalogenase
MTASMPCSPGTRQSTSHLWREFELGAVSKDFLKVERFRRTFAQNALELDPEAASHLYLESLSDTVVLIDGAKQVCEALCAIGEVGIITNGVEHRSRAAASPARV